MLSIIYYQNTLMSLKQNFFNRNPPKPIETTICSICYSPLTDAKLDVSTTRCNHLFCTSCIIKSTKFANTCPLCRTELTSPNKKFSIKFNRSKHIVLEELHYYKSYIGDNINYIMDTIEYHTNGKTLTPSIKHTLHTEILEVFENFGMGICLNINSKYGNYNVYNTGSTEQPNSPVEPPPSIESERDTEAEAETILGGAVTADAVNNVVNLPPI